MDAFGTMHGQTPAPFLNHNTQSIHDRQHTVHIMPRSHLHLEILVGVLFVVLVGVAALVWWDRAVEKPVANLTPSTLRVGETLQIGTSSKLSYFTFGTVSPSIPSDVSAPIQVPVTFPAPAPVTPNVHVTVVQSGTSWAGVSCTVRDVSRTGFTAIVSVPSAVVTPNTDPLTIDWSAHA